MSLGAAVRLAPIARSSGWAAQLEKVVVVFVRPKRKRRFS